MTKENNHGPYEFLGNMVVSLMNVDPSVSISFLETEIHVSRRDVCAMRQGKDLHLYQYVRVMNLVIGTVPHRPYGNSQPADWRVVMKWDGVRG